MQALVVVTLNLLLGAALWGLGMLLRKRRNTVVGEIQDREIQLSTYGAVKPILYGQCKTALQVVHAMDLTPFPVEEGGGKDAYTQIYYLATWAGILGIWPDENVFGLPVLGKLWLDDKLAVNYIDGEVVATGPWWDLKGRFYDGSSTQIQDPTLTTYYSGYGNPAYRYRPLIVIRDLNVTYYGNRIPNIRALIAGATEQPDCNVIKVPGGFRDGSNCESFYSMQLIMSVDYSFIVIGFPRWNDGYPDGDGYMFQKIDCYTGQMISERFFTWGEAEATFCSHEPTTGYTDPFGWHHPSSMDEQGRVYAAICQGFGGKWARLNSDTWEIEQLSVGNYNDPAQIIADTGYTTGNAEWEFMFTRVSRNPDYPYMWATTASIEQGHLGFMAVAMLDREAMCNPFDENHWGHIWWGPRGRTPEEGDQYYFKPGAIALNNTDGSCFCLWTSVRGGWGGVPLTREVWLSRFFPDGSRLDVIKDEGQDDLSYYNYNVMWHQMTYDPETNQLIILANDSAGGLKDPCMLFFNGDTLMLIAKVPLMDECDDCVDGCYITTPDGNWNEDSFQHEPVNGLIHWHDEWGGDDPPYCTKIYRMDVRSRQFQTMCYWPYWEYPTYGGTFMGMQYHPIKNTVFTELYNGDYWDSMLYEVTFKQVEMDVVWLDDIVYDLCRRSGLAHDQINVTDLAGVPVRGYQVSQDQTAREALEPLMEVFIFDAVDVDGVLVFRRRGGPSLLTIPEEDLGVFISGNERPEPLEIEQPEETELPWKVEVHYPDVDYKHEPRVQSWERQNTASTRIEKIQCPILLNSTEAKNLANVSMKYLWNAKPVSLTLGPKYARLVPTDVIVIDRSEGPYRILLLEAERHGLMTRWKGVVESFEYTPYPAEE